MTLAGHTGKILKFWLQIQNLFEIWAQMIIIYRLTLVNLILGLENQNGHIKGYRPEMKIHFSNPESAHQIGLDYI